MPWNPRNTMSLRREFVELALQPGANRRQLCQRFEISPKTGYKWLERFEAHGASGLEDRSRRPLHSPVDYKHWGR
jgi:transposase-like protein